MNNQYSYYQMVYERLLTDIVLNTGVHLGTPIIDDEWVLHQGPKLDKQLLMHLEGKEVRPPFPEWLEPLAEKFFLTEDPSLLKALRNLLVFCYKTEKEPTNAQLNEAQASFVDTDTLLDLWHRMFIHSNQRDSRVEFARIYISRVICNVDWSDILPFHGPGAVYPSRKPWQKSSLTRCFSSITSLYPLDSYYCGLPSFWDEVLVRGDKDIQEVRDEIVANLVAVPKDSRGPRLICVHPSECIWIQQGQRVKLEHAISHSFLTRNSIRFTDQTVNGNLALRSSADQEYSTIDLSEASDRIHTALVDHLFGSASKYLSCTRATHVRLLNGELHRLRKWAPMGNCLTFPVESLIFWAIARSSIFVEHREVRNDIYVFGDDIIVPTKFVDSVIRGLTLVGLKVNERKTFRSGFFRESCGVDAFKGKDVTPYRTRQADIRTTQGLVSYLDLAKRLCRDGYRFTSGYIYASIRKRLGYLPLCNNFDAQGVFEYVPTDLGHLLTMEPNAKWRKTTHQWSVQCRMVKGRFRPPEDNWCCLQDSLLSLERGGSRDRGLEYPLPYAARLGYGWIDMV